MSIRPRLVSQARNKLISNSEQQLNVTNLSLKTFGLILAPNPCGKNLANSQINPGTMHNSITMGQI